LGKNIKIQRSGNTENSTLKYIKYNGTKYFTLTVTYTQNILCVVHIIALQSSELKVSHIF